MRETSGDLEALGGRVEEGATRTRRGGKGISRGSGRRTKPIAEQLPERLEYHVGI